MYVYNECDCNVATRPGPADLSSRTVAVERVTRTGAAAILASATGPRRILVLKVTVPQHRQLLDRESRPVTDVALNTALVDVREFYLAASSNQLQLTHQLHPATLTLGDDTDTTCWSFAQITSAARTAATAAGLDVASFHHVLHVLPDSFKAACDPVAIARATVPGREMVTYGWLTQNALAHELGHNLGSRHSVNAVCTTAGSPVALADGCTLPDGQHPGDDLLGNARFAHNGFHRSVYGWVSPSTITASGCRRSASEPATISAGPPASVSASIPITSTLFRTPFGSVATSRLL